MENKNVKVISIPLYAIITIVVVIIGIVVLSNRYITANGYEMLTEVAFTEENDEKTNLRNIETVSSRSAETARSEAIADKYENANKEENQNEIEEQKAEEENTEIETQNYISVQDITISQDMDLTVRTGISKEDFVDLISRVKADKSKFFYENAETIYDLCEKYELNEIFFCGLISAESGWNIASNHRSTYNYISLMVNGKLKQFSSVEDGLEEAAKALHENYLTPGGRFYHGKTLSGVKTRFCPSSSTWTSLVYGRMKQIYNSK